MPAVPPPRRPVHPDYVQTYFTLRLALGVLALSLPLLLVLGGLWLQGLPVLPSISAYYWSDLRVVFVGTMWAVGLGLVAYQGLSRREDWALNFGGVLAAAIGLFPMEPCKALACILPDCTDGSCARRAAPYDGTSESLLALGWHYPAAVAFYAVLGFVMVFCAHSTLHLVPRKQRRLFLALYPTLGVVFFGSMVVAAILLRAQPGTPACQDHMVFGIEVAGIVSFAAWWFAKTIECRLHHTDARITVRRRPMQVLPKEVAMRPMSMTLAPVDAAAAEGPSRSGWAHWKALWRDEVVTQ